MKTWRVIDLITWTTGYFQKQAISSARLDAELLLAHALGIKRLELYMRFQDAVMGETLTSFRGLVKQRADRVPLAYLTHEREFMGLSFYVDAQVLVPRPETESLVELVESRQQGDAQVLEIGTGSGAIAVSLAQRKGWDVVATDISAEALEIAYQNAQAHAVETQLTFVQGDLFDPIDGSKRFDWVVSNPPYISSSVLPTLEPELSHEPASALDGGSDGLDVIRPLIAEAPSYLKRGGKVLIEIGHDQSEAVKRLVSAEPAYTACEVLQDYSKAERFILAQCDG